MLGATAAAAAAAAAAAVAADAVTASHHDDCSSLYERGYREGRVEGWRAAGPTWRHGHR